MFTFNLICLVQGSSYCIVILQKKLDRIYMHLCNVIALCYQNTLYVC